MSFGTTDNAQTVLQAVNKLFHDSNAAEKEKASRWLGEFQKSVFAWETADQLLRLKNDVESTYFAAQTMRTKILYSFSELPVDSHDSLKESLLNHIEELANMSPILTTQLALAVCDLALQMTSWGMPAVTFIQKYGQERTSLPYLLEILTVLPEEVNNQTLRLGANRRAEIMEEMENSAPMVVDLLKACIDIVEEEKLLSKIFKCLASWFHLGVLPGNHVARSKLLDVPFNVLRDVSTSSTLHEAASDCICAALYAAEDVARYRDLMQLLFHGTHSLREAYHNAVAHEDTDKCLNLCRIFTELAESLSEALVSAPGDGLGDLVTLDLLLLCNGHCQYEVAEITFNLWYRLSEMLYSNDHNELRLIFGPYIERLICSLVRHCQMEPDNDKLLDEADDFYDFRLRSADLVRDVVYLVGATKCFAQLFTMLNQDGASPTWDILEATLFIMAAVAKHIDCAEDAVVPQVLQAIVSLPPDSHLAVRHTSIRLIGELSLWIEKHSQLLDHILQFLTQALHQKELSSIAALSLQNLCESCRAQMIQHYSALIQLLQVADDLNVSAEASIGLLKGVVTIITELPVAHLQEAVGLLCKAQINVLTQQLQPGSKPSAKDPTLWLDRLAAIFRYIEIKSRNGEPHPCKEVTEEVWKVLRPTLEQHKSDNRIVERWCRCVRFAIRCVGKSVQGTLLSPIAETITSIYTCYQHSCFLYLGSVLVDEYGIDPALLAMLNAFTQPTFEILNAERGLANNPDTVDDLFRLCCRFVEKCPVEFLTHGACPSLLDCALVGLSHEHRDANASVTKFLRSVIECKLPPDQKQITDNVFAAYGGQIVEKSLHACLFQIPSYLYPDIAELWWAIIERDRQSFSGWLMTTLKNLPTEATLATATPQQTMQFHAEIVAAAEWKTVSYHLRDFCRLYR